MLKRLHIKNYILIDSLEIDFPESLIIITGQTGAGKSIIMGALSLIMGAKAEASVVGDTAENCILEAEFDLDSKDEELLKMLDDNGVDMDVNDIDGCEAGKDGERLIIRRVVNKTGRSRSFINDCPVRAPFLSELASKLVDIHSQHQTLLLSDKKFQLSLLDLYADNSKLLVEYKSRYNRLIFLKSQISALDEKIALVARDRDYNVFRLSELESAKLVEGELEELELELKQLANSEEIKTTFCEIEALFEAQNDYDSQPLTTSLKEIEKKLSKLCTYMPQLDSFVERLASLRLDLDDINSEISGMNSTYEFSSTRLEFVESRISLLYSLMSKHNVKTVSELIEIYQELSSEVYDSDKLTIEKESLSLEVATVLKEIEGLSTELHNKRARYSIELAALIQSKLKGLELHSAGFSINLSPTTINVSGADEISFLFSSTGNKLQDVSKCASGGELSRIMLVIKSIMALYANMPTMIFDEIDTGVSGSVADKMGSLICEMGKNMQVFAITHLPQVAAKGSAHYLVEKEEGTESNSVRSTIKKLSDEQRVYELARMLSGSEMTTAAIENAKSLLHL